MTLVIELTADQINHAKPPAAAPEAHKVVTSKELKVELTTAGPLPTRFKRGQVVRLNGVTLRLTRTWSQTRNGLTMYRLTGVRVEENS